MKLLTYFVSEDPHRVPRLGMLDDSEKLVIGLQRAHHAFVSDLYRTSSHALSEALFGSMQTFIETGEFGMDQVKQVVSWLDGKPLEYLQETLIAKTLSSVTVMPPLPRPVSVRDCLTFHDHAAAGYERRASEMPSQWFEIPIHYRTSHTSIAGAEDPIIWPSYSSWLDFELELAMVTSRGGTNIRVEDAHEYIFGYTIFNDVSARDTQYNEMPLNLGPAKGKSFKNANIFGPYLVTADAFDPRDLTAWVRVNGEEWSRTTSARMEHSFEEILAYISADEEIHPGEIIASGTFPNSCGVDIGRRIELGDLIELHIEGIGTLRNRVESSDSRPNTLTTSGVRDAH